MGQFFEGRQELDKGNDAKAYKLFCAGQVSGDESEKNKCRYGEAICLLEGKGTLKNELKAKELLQFCYNPILQLATRNDPEAQYIIAIFFYFGFTVRKSYKKAIYWYTKAAEGGDPVAQYNLGLCFQEGNGVKKSMEKATEWFLIAARNGDNDAQYNLGCCYENGDGIEKSIKKAIYWYTKAAEGGVVDAQHNLGLSYANGDGVKKSIKKAIYWYTKAAEGGLAEAQINLGLCYAEEKSSLYSFDKASFWWEMAAKQGNVNAIISLGLLYFRKKQYTEALYWFRKVLKVSDLAQYLVGLCYLHGYGVEKSIKKAFSLLRQAANNGNFNAMNELGVCYEKGTGVEKNFQKAFDLYKEAANNDVTEAQNNLGRLYENGLGVDASLEEAYVWYSKAAYSGYAAAQNNLGVFYGVKSREQSFGNAVKWFRKSAKQMNADAQFNLGISYENGCGVKKSYSQAVNWYRMAAENGSIDAWNNLGACYQRGRGVPKSFEEAVACFTKAAKNGNANAQCNLGNRYFNGEGVGQSYQRAFSLYKSAAEQGHIDAQNNLAICYYNGLGVEKSYDKAIYWWQKAIEKDGHNVAEFNIGVCFDLGTGFIQSYEQAFQWYEKSALQGNKEAQFNLGVLYENGEGVEQSKEMALHWYSQAKQNGDMDAVNALGVLYYEMQKYDLAREEFLLFIKKYEKTINDYSKQEADDILKLLGKSAYYLGNCFYQDSIPEIDTSEIRSLEDLIIQINKRLIILRRIQKYFELAKTYGYQCEYALKMVERDISIEMLVRSILQSEKRKGVRIEDIREEFISKTRTESKKDSYLDSDNDVKIQRNALKEYIKKIRNLAQKKYAKKISATSQTRQMVNSLKEKNVIKLRKVTNILSKKFGKSLWDNLHKETQVALKSGFLTFGYVGKGDTSKFDYALIIGSLAKALEIELKEYFFTGYLRYLKHIGAPEKDFYKGFNSLRQSPILNIISRHKEGYEEYEFSHEKSNQFTLGSFYWVIDSQENSARDYNVKRMNSTSIVTMGNNEKTALRTMESRSVMGSGYSKRTINQYMLSYAKELFKEDVFSEDNSEREIVNYLIDLSTDIKVITSMRNPGAHGTTMTYDQALITADYLLMNNDFFGGMMSKIREQYIKRKEFYIENIGISVKGGITK